MQIDTKELSALVRFCRKHGVTRLRTSDIEIELGPTPAKRHRGKSGPDLSTKSTPMGDVSQSPFLLWSAPDFQG